MKAHTYIRVRWHHDEPAQPVDLWSELDAGRFETRKMEIFRDGSTGFADGAEAILGTRLGTVPIPALTEIAANPEFEPSEISETEFEQRWSTRLTQPR